MATARTRRVTQQRSRSLRAQKLISKQIQRQQAKQVRRTVLSEVKQIVPATQQKPEVNYSSAWETAMKHFNKGMAGAYLYWMGRETDPQERAIYTYVKELVKQQRIGNISPTGTKLAAEKVKLTMFPEIARQEQQAAIAKYNKEHPSLIANKYKLSTSASDILSGKIFKGVGAIKDDVPIEARLKPVDIAAIIRGKDIGKIITEKRKILEKVVVRDTSKFKISLKNSSKKLPPGVTFAKDNKGDIVGIIDRNINRRVPLGSLNKYISDKKLIKLGLGSMVRIRFDAKELASRVKITASNIPGKVIVEFPNRQKGTINSKGRVVVGARLAGHKYTFQDGVIIAVDDKTTFAREEFVPTPSITKLKERKKEAGITKISEAERKIIKFLKNKSKKWSQDIATTKGILRNANQRGDLDKLRELQKLGKNRSPSQTLEYNRLKKQTARNYELGGELVGKIIGTSLINMGVGTKELLEALSENPKETLIALPPAIYEGVSQDFNRVMSGDPLEVVSVPLEWYTFGKVAKIFSKASKASIGIGRTLSPKYFSGIGTKLLIPPTTLRRVAIKTAIGRKVLSSINKALDRPGVKKQITAFNKKMKVQSKLVDRRLASIQRRAKAVKIKVVKKVVIAKTKIQLKRSVTKSLKQAKKMRLRSAKKGRTLHLTSPNYKQGLSNINVLSDSIARVKTYEFLNKFVEGGGAITKKQVDELLEVVKKQYRNKLEGTAEYQALQRLSRQDRFLSVKLIKLGKIKSARIFFNKLIKRVQSIPAVKLIGKNLSSIKRGVKIRIKKVRKPIIKARRRVKMKIKGVREKVRIKKRRVLKKIKRPFLLAAEKRRVKKTIRYRMEKARPLRQVTLDQLQRTQSITAMNKFIDRFFRELELRQKITVAPKTYSQMKNILKKRMRKAIKTGDKAEIKTFGEAIRKLAVDINKKSNKPTVRTKMKPFKVEGKPAPKKFQIKTIQEFEPTTPKGTYQEVKVGNTILLQKVKTKQIQKAKVISVQKKAVSLKPLVQYGVKSLSATAVKNILKSKQAFAKITNQSQLSKVLQDSAQDLKALQVLGQAITPKTNVASAVASLVNSKVRISPRLRTKQITKQKKKFVKVRMQKKFTKRKIPKKVPVFYIKVKKKGRMVNLLPRPLILKDAKDYLAYKLDKNLVRTAYFEPIGKAKNVVRLPSNIRGYYLKVRHKIRPYKIRVGKKKLLRNGYIEKRKYALDQKKELAQLKKARAKRKRTITKKTKKVVHKKKTRTTKKRK